jgi:DNA-binding NarL/FixJ family response regulator
MSVLVVDDDALARAWVRQALEGADDFKLAGEASSAAEGAVMVVRRRPQFLLVDYRLPDEFGTDLVHRLRKQGVDAPALLMTSHPQQGLNEMARESGAQGVVVKRADSSELLAAMRLAAAGTSVFEPAHPRRSGHDGALAPREREVLRLAATGLSTQGIADTLGIGAESVKTLLSRGYKKLGAANRADAITKAHELGVL